MILSLFTFKSVSSNAFFFSPYSNNLLLYQQYLNFRLSGCVVDFPVFYYVHTDSQMLAFSPHT